MQLLQLEEQLKTALLSAEIEKTKEKRGYFA